MLTVAFAPTTRGRMAAVESVSYLAIQHRTAKHPHFAGELVSGKPNKVKIVQSGFVPHLVDAASIALRWPLHNLVTFGNWVTLVHIFPNLKIQKQKKKQQRCRGKAKAIK
ncbi:hypothetical protein ACFXTH_000929 [Malus domestica]